MDTLFSDINPFSLVAGEIDAILRATITLLPNILAACVALLITFGLAWLVTGLVRRVLRRSDARPSLVSAMTTLTRLGIWLAGGLIALTILFPNLTPTKLLAGLGIGSIAIGLAFKDVFENFLAGFLILLRKPMRIGDDIECDSLSGRVEHISIRDTFLRKRSGELIIVPNSFLYKNPVKVLTDQALRRISLVVGVAYGEDVDRAREVICQAVEAIDSVSRDKPVQVFAATFNASSVDFSVRWWTDSAPIDEHRSRDAVLASIKRALDDAEIEIPFPYRTMTFKEPLQITRERDASDDMRQDAA